MGAARAPASRVKAVSTCPVDPSHQVVITKRSAGTLHYLCDRCALGGLTTHDYLSRAFGVSR